MLDVVEIDTRSITTGTSSENEDTDDKEELETDEDDCEGKWNMG